MNQQPQPPHSRELDSFQAIHDMVAAPLPPTEQLPPPTLAYEARQRFLHDSGAYAAGHSHLDEPDLFSVAADAAGERAVAEQRAQEQAAAAEQHAQERGKVAAAAHQAVQRAREISQETALIRREQAPARLEAALDRGNWDDARTQLDLLFEEAVATDNWDAFDSAFEHLSADQKRIYTARIEAKGAIPEDAPEPVAEQQQPARVVARAAVPAPAAAPAPAQAASVPDVDPVDDALTTWDSTGVVSGTASGTGNGGPATAPTTAPAPAVPASAERQQQPDYSTTPEYEHAAITFRGVPYRTLRAYDPAWVDGQFPAVRQAYQDVVDEMEAVGRQSAVRPAAQFDLDPRQDQNAARSTPQYQGAFAALRRASNEQLLANPPESLALSPAEIQAYRDVLAERGLGQQAQAPRGHRGNHRVGAGTPLRTGAPNGGAAGERQTRERRWGRIGRGATLAVVALTSTVATMLFGSVSGDGPNPSADAAPSVNTTASGSAVRPPIVLPPSFSESAEAGGQNQNGAGQPNGGPAGGTEQGGIAGTSAPETVNLAHGQTIWNDIAKTRLGLAGVPDSQLTPDQLNQVAAETQRIVALNNLPNDGREMRDDQPVRV